MLAILMPIFIIILLILANGLFVAAEFAIAAASRPRVVQLAESGSREAERVLEILSDRNEMNRYISTAQVGITLASLGLGMYGEHAVAEWLLHSLEEVSWVGVATAHTVATVVAVGFLTYLHVVIGEMVPKSLALQSSAKAAVRLSATMVFAERVFRPLTMVLNWIGNKLLELAGVPPAEDSQRFISAAELAYIVEESSESGFFDPTEQTYLENVIDFHERSVGQVMTPRNRIIALPLDADQQMTLEIVCHHRHSRFPIYEEDRDHIVGVLHVKDLSRQLIQPNGPFVLGNLVRPAAYVPESLPLDEMLGQFRQAHIQIAIVLDEYGGTAGLVTLEDLAEEIIGEIQDEFDEEIAPMTEIDSDTLRVRGDLLLDELTQHYDLDFQAEESETVGGLIMSHLGQVARAGDTIQYGDLSFEVEEIDGLAIQTAIVYLPSHEEPEDNASSQWDNPV